LGEAIKSQLCDVASLRWKGRRCKCGDPKPVMHRCVYGSCVIYRCNNCHRCLSVVRVSKCFLAEEP